MFQFVGTTGTLDATDPFRLGEKGLVVRIKAKTASIQVRRASSLDVDQPMFFLRRLVLKLGP